MRWMNCGAEAGALDDGAAGAVDLEAAQLAPGARPPTAPASIAASRPSRAAANARAYSSGTVGPGEADPRDVSKDRARRRQLTPEVEQQHLVGTNGAVHVAAMGW